MTAVVNIPKYEPICAHCGHHPGRHTAVSCENGAPIRNLGLTGLADCRCPGWKRDETWPPPLVLREGVDR